MKYATCLLFLCLLALAPSPLFAQSADASADDAIYLELGGPGVLYSVNYERFFAPEWSVRVGASAFGLSEGGSGDSMSALVVPITAQYLFFDGSHHLEVGAGLHTGLIRSDLNSYGDAETFGLIAATAAVGYRYQPVDGGLVLRATFTPMYWGERFAVLGSTLQPWASVSVGWAF